MRDEPIPDVCMMIATDSDGGEHELLARFHAPKSLCAGGWKVSKVFFEKYHVDALFDKIAALEADAARMKLVVAAAHNWSADRVIDDCDEAELMKAIWRFDGDRTEPCEGCDGQCGEPCAPTTVNAAIAEIDRWIARKSAAMQAKP